MKNFKANTGSIVVNAITLDAVRSDLAKYSRFSEPDEDGYRWIDTKAFEMAVIFHSNDLKQSVNQIVAHFKAINGVNDGGKS